VRIPFLQEPDAIPIAQVVVSACHHHDEISRLGIVDHQERASLPEEKNYDDSKQN